MMILLLCSFCGFSSSWDYVDEHALISIVGVFLAQKGRMALQTLEGCDDVFVYTKESVDSALDVQKAAEEMYPSFERLFEGLGLPQDRFPDVGALLYWADHALPEMDDNQKYFARIATYMMLGMSNQYVESHKKSLFGLGRGVKNFPFILQQLKRFIRDGSFYRFFVREGNNVMCSMIERLEGMAREEFLMVLMKDLDKPCDINGREETHVYASEYMNYEGCRAEDMCCDRLVFNTFGEHLYQDFVGKTLDVIRSHWRAKGLEYIVAAWSVFYVRGIHDLDVEEGDCFAEKLRIFLVRSFGIVNENIYYAVEGLLPGNVLTGLSREEKNYKMAQKLFAWEQELMHKVCAYFGYIDPGIREREICLMIKQEWLLEDVHYQSVCGCIIKEVLLYIFAEEKISHSKKEKVLTYIDSLRFLRPTTYRIVDRVTRNVQHNDKLVLRVPLKKHLTTWTPLEKKQFLTEILRDLVSEKPQNACYIEFIT